MIALTRNSARRYCWITAVATIACSTSRSSESQSSYAQKVDTVTEEGSWTVRTWEFAPPARSPNGPQGNMPEPTLPRPTQTPHNAVGGARPTQPSDGKSFGPAAGHSDGDTVPYGPLLRYTEETHDPSKIKTGASVIASGSAEAESKSRPFGIFALLAAGWPFLLGACGAAALVVLKKGWFGIAFTAAKSSLGLVKSLFGKGK